jgi:hypothetical protein
MDFFLIFVRVHPRTIPDHDFANSIHVESKLLGTQVADMLLIL